MNRLVARKIHAYLTARAVESYMRGDDRQVALCDVLAGALRRLT